MEEWFDYAVMVEKIAGEMRKLGVGESFADRLEKITAAVRKRAGEKASHAATSAQGAPTPPAPVRPRGVVAGNAYVGPYGENG